MQSKFFRELIRRIIEGKIKDKKEVIKLIEELVKKNKLRGFPKLSRIRLYANKEELTKLDFLKIKPVRTISGVSVVAVMSRPIKCPKEANCIYCPGGPSSYFGDVPKSYTGKEPATRRAIRNNFDPYLQIFNRLEQYIINQHPIDKIELIIMGGTFSSFPIKYQDEFISYCFKALNDFGKLFFKKNEFDFIKFRNFFELHGDINDERRIEKVNRKILKYKKKSCLLKEQIRNEKAKVRCIGLCLETRPDYCKKEHINQMLKLGCTRVELGIQSIYDDVLKKVKRGHDVDEIVKTTKLLKDSFLKVTYQIMIGLPGSDKLKDIRMFKILFSDERFKPDSLKIYPCMVLKGTELHNLYKEERYKPLSTDEAAEIIVKGKKFIPKYTRIIRIQRDIPTMQIVSGVNVTNLRQYIHERNVKCDCIRCREIKNFNIKGSLKLKRIDYTASDGREIFLGYEIKDKIVGFLRLRIPCKPFRKEIKKGTAGIRELHIYSNSLGLGVKSRESFQHRGLGKELIKEAEKIAKEEFDISKIIVISGIGVKQYYKNKAGYKKKGIYMCKIL